MRFKAAHRVPVFERESRAVVFVVKHLHVFRKRVLRCFLHFLSEFSVFRESHEGRFKHSAVSTAQRSPSQQEDEQSLTAIHAGVLRVGLGVIYYLRLVSQGEEHHTHAVTAKNNVSLWCNPKMQDSEKVSIVTVLCGDERSAGVRVAVVRSGFAPLL